MFSLVMTGATRGIGRVAAEQILRTAPDIHLTILARDGGSGAPKNITQSEQVTFIEADLGSIASTRDAARAVTSLLDTGALPPLRGFIGNAGVQHTDNVHVTTDGFEATIAVNVLANHVLLSALRDHFEAPSRLLITTSDTHFGNFRHNLGMVPAPQWMAAATLCRPAAFPNPESVRAGRMAYSTSKLAVIHLVHEWARRLPDGVNIASYNPGLVPGTGLARDAGPLGRLAFRFLLPALALTPLADTPTAAGQKLAEAILGVVPAAPGAYIDRDRATPSSATSYNDDRERDLWDVAETIMLEHS